MMFALMLACGLGVQDVVAVKVQDLRLNERVVRLGDGRQIALPPTLVQLLQQYVHGARERILTNRRSEHLFPRRAGGAISPEGWRLAASGLTFKFWRRLNQDVNVAH
jgi:site-specific recombinase XerD